MKKENIEGEWSLAPKEQKLLLPFPFFSSSPLLAKMSFSASASTSAAGGRKKWNSQMMLPVSKRRKLEVSFPLQPNKTTIGFISLLFLEREPPRSGATCWKGGRSGRVRRLLHRSVIHSFLLRHSLNLALFLSSFFFFAVHHHQRVMKLMTF